LALYPGVMAGTTYRRPDSLESLLRLLHDEGDGAKVLAGGQSLIPLVSLGLAQPRLLLDINFLPRQLPGFDDARLDHGWASVGPLVRHHQLEAASLGAILHSPLLPAAARLIGHPAIRTRGTFLGSLAHADPAAEWPAVAVALDAQLRLVSARGERWVGAGDFFIGPLTTQLRPDEVLLEARWAAAPPRSGAAVQELTYRHGDYAIVGVAAQVSLDADGAIAGARLALFGVGDTPVRATAAEAGLRGGGTGGFAAAAAAAQAAADPASDATASAAYRQEMIGVLTLRALEEAYARARAAIGADEPGLVGPAPT
jgi:aerobic carbon-monoxide dehydrogenase medium subunit